MFVGKVIRMNGARLRQHCHRVPLSARKHPLRKSQCQRLALVKSQHTARAIRFQRAGRSESDTALPVVAFNLQVTSYLFPLLQAHHLIAAEVFPPPPPPAASALPLKTHPSVSFPPMYLSVLHDKNICCCLPASITSVHSAICHHFV